MATVHQFSRRAVAGDLPAILRIDHLAASGDRQRAEFLRHSLDLGECRVYVIGEVVAGFVVVLPAHFFGRDFVELLIVDPAHRRSGIGRSLLREALATAGTAQVFTSTNASNRPMRALLTAEDWSFSGGLGGLDEGDPELVFYQNRPARPGPRTD
jgi:GNAT superfamily N-acetyltransferase